MNLSGLALVALKSLYEAPDQRGDLVALLQQKNARMTIDEAQAAGWELERYGLIYLIETRAYDEAVIRQLGIKYVQSNQAIIGSALFTRCK